MHTDAAIAGGITGTPSGKAVESITRVINCSAAKFKIEAPYRKESNEGAFSGKTQTTTAKAVFTYSYAGLLVMGRVEPDCNHAIAALHTLMPFPGYITRGMETYGTPQDRCTSVNLDKGMIRTDREWFSTSVKIFVKRDKGEAALSV